MGAEIPKWAYDRVREMRAAVDAEKGKEAWRYNTAEQAFAAYIAAHEEPPADPLLIEARKVFNEWNTWDADAKARVLCGSYDFNDHLQLILKGLRRGIELAKEQSQ